MPRGNRETKQTKRSSSTGHAAPAQRLQLLRNLHIFSSIVREILELRPLQDASGVSMTLSQLNFLRAAALDGERQVGEVAGLLGVSAAAATKSIDKLERLGLVARNPSKGDRRATLLTVSSKGKRLLHKYEGLKAERLDPALEEFTDQELDRMTLLLERLSLSLLGADYSGNEFCLRCGAYIEESCWVGERGGGCPYQRAFGPDTAERAPQEPP